MTLAARRSRLGTKSLDECERLEGWDGLRTRSAFALPSGPCAWSSVGAWLHPSTASGFRCPDSLTPWPDIFRVGSEASLISEVISSVHRRRPLENLSYSLLPSSASPEHTWFPLGSRQTGALTPINPTPHVPAVVETGRSAHRSEFTQCHLFPALEGPAHTCVFSGLTTH